MAPPPRTAGLILCGGRSRRMGHDKAALRVGPRSLLARTVERMAEVAAPVAVSLAEGQALPRLPAGVWAVRDPRPDEGPLAGLHEGFRRLQGAAERVVVMPVDMPFWTPPWPARLVNALDSADAAAYRYEGYTNALTAAYRLSLLPRLEALVAGGARRPIRLLEAGRLEVFVAEDYWRPGQGPPPLMDVDTPAEYREALLWEGIGQAGGVPVEAVGEADGARPRCWLPVYARTVADAWAALARVWPEHHAAWERLRDRGRAAVEPPDAPPVRVADWSRPLRPGERARFVPPPAHGSP